jgi:hypothetical protein
MFMPKKINMLLVGGLTVLFLGAETRSVGGVLGSFGLWLHTFWRKHRPDEIQRNLARLPALMREAKSLPLEKLGEIEEELDTLSGWLLERFLYEKIAPDRINGVAVIISHIRLVIERRRKAA